MDNLLTYEEKKLVRREYTFRVCSVFLLLCFVVESFGVVFLIPAYIYAEAKEVVANVAQANIFKLKAEDEEVFSKLKKLGRQVDALQPQTVIPLSQTIKILLAHTGNGLKVTSIITSEAGQRTHGLTVSGRASTRQTLLAFKSSMEGEPNVSLVDIPVSAFAEDRNINFTAKITFQYVSP